MKLKPVFNFEANPDQKLERAFRTIVGPTQTRDYQLALFKTALRDLGFKIQNSLVEHPAVQGRKIPLPTGGVKDPLVDAFAFINHNFPETEFHLPFILAKAQLQEKIRSGGTLEPEPDYDEDGFLTT